MKYVSIATATQRLKRVMKLQEKAAVEFMEADAVNSIEKELWKKRLDENTAHIAMWKKYLADFTVEEHAEYVLSLRETPNIPCITGETHRA